MRSLTLVRLYFSACLCFVVCAVPAAAGAHAVSNAYLELTRQREGLHAEWRMALRDVDAALALDRDGDGRIDDTELSESRGAIEEYLLSRLTLSSDARVCRLAPRGLHTSGSSLVLELESTECAGALSVRYDLFFEHDRSHRAYLRLAGASPFEHVFTNGAREVALAGDAQPRSAFFSYVGQGVWHILIGLDHVLFVLTLLLGATLRFEAGRYVAVEGFRRAFVGMAKIVTAFTAAHSLTLSAMALGVVSPPSRWVETAIALSIVAAAANNLWPVITRRTWLLAFLFGLIHGLGFASVLVELGLPRGQVLVALLGFNVGVELGQLGIVALGFPLAFWLRTSPAYRRFGLGLGSAVIGALGLVWAAERALDVSWLSRSEEAAPTASRFEPPRARPCDGVSALAEPTLYDAVMENDEGGAAAREARDAYRLACRGELGPSARAFDQALAAAGDATPPLTLAALLTSYAELELLRGEHDHAEELFARAEPIWRAQGAHEPLAATLGQLAELMARQGRWADVYRFYDEARRLHELSGDAPGLGRALSRLGDVLVSAADPRAAKRRYEEAQAVYERAGDFASVALQYQNLAIVARLDGDATAAAQMYRRALELHRRYGHEPDVAADLAALARTHLGLGEYAEARARYEEANVIERRLGRARQLAKNYNQLGNLHQLEGELETAERMYREALTFSERARDTTEAANNWANLAAVEHKQGRVARARALYAKSLELFEQSGAKVRALRVRGLLASLAATEP